MKIEIEIEKAAACVAFADAYSDKVRPKEMVELYEYYLLLGAYQFLKAANKDLQDHIASLAATEQKA